MKLKNLLLESTNIAINDVEDAYSKANSWETSSKSMLGTLVDFYYSNEETERQSAIRYIELLNSVIEHLLSIKKKLNIPYVSVKTIKHYLLTSQEEFKNNIEDFFPFPLYVSTSMDEMDTIGIMVSYDGKVLEIHEGNDEASEETINFVNSLVNPTGKDIRIYGSHTQDVINHIELYDYIPKGIYVSPHRTHAEGYWAEDRMLFTGIININDISQESDIDWRTIAPTKIKKFKVL